MKEFKIVIHFIRKRPDPGQATTGSFTFHKRAPNLQLAKAQVESEFDRTYANVLTRTQTVAS